jgi:hypothetical protein
MIWDGVRAHRGTCLGGRETKRVGVPPSSPELNPAERVFAAVSRAVEGE